MHLDAMEVVKIYREDARIWRRVQNALKSRDEAL